MRTLSRWLCINQDFHLSLVSIVKLSHQDSLWKELSYQGVSTLQSAPQQQPLGLFNHFLSSANICYYYCSRLLLRCNIEKFGLMGLHPGQYFSFFSLPGTLLDMASMVQNFFCHYTVGTFYSKGCHFGVKLYFHEIWWLVHLGKI